MFQYLTKFKKLPKEMQTVVSSAEATKIIDGWEEKYGIDLASDMIKIMVKEIPWQGLAMYLKEEHHLTEEQAGELQQEMVAKIFHSVKYYLGINKDAVSKIVNKPQSNSAQTYSRAGKPVQLVNIQPASIEELLSLAGLSAQSGSLTTGQAGASSGDALNLENLTNRLQNIVNIFNKGVRDSLDTRETLIKSEESGGLGLDKEKADAVIARLKQGKAPESKLRMERPKSPFDSLEQLRDVEYSFKENTPAPKKPTVPVPQDIEVNEGASPLKPTAERVNMKKEITSAMSGLLKKVSGKKQLAPPPPAVIKQPVSGENKIQETIIQTRQKPSFQIGMEDVQKANSMPAESLMPKKPEANLQPEKVTVNRPTVPIDNLNRPRLNDVIKPVGRLQGPIEELAGLDLTRFSRLGGTAEEIIDKIKQKVELLGEESLTKRQQGINAWRHSPVYKMYLAIGQESMQSAKPITDIIKSQPGGLSEEQFNAILELNRMLSL